MDKIINELKIKLNQAHEAERKAAASYGHCHPYTQGISARKERIRRQLGAILREEV